MEKLVTLCLLFMLSGFLIVNFVVGERNGFTIRLIHRDSPESPMYNPNLTYIQQIEKLVDQSEARLEHLFSSHNNLRSKVISENNYIFLTQIGIGTFRNSSEPFKSYYLSVDTGSALTWLECHDCKRHKNHCLRPNSVPFPDVLSESYAKLSCKPTQGQQLHPLCKLEDCIGDYCGYKIQYADHSTSKGYLATEIFTFDKEKAPKLVFGCGFDMTNVGHPDTSKISGVLGLGWGPESFVTQLGTKSNGKFSYCLPEENFSPYLRFGDSIPTTRFQSHTPLLKYGNLEPYFVNLTGISVSGRRLNLTERDFVRTPDNTGGCVIDSGSALSHIADAVYIKLREALVNNFDRISGLKKVQVPKYDLCYKSKGSGKGLRNLPTVTFHLQYADLQLYPMNLFIKISVGKKDSFCLTMLPNRASSRVSLIGAYQQMNYRFVYDTHERVLHFGQEKCKTNS